MKARAVVLESKPCGCETWLPPYGFPIENLCKKHQSEANKGGLKMSTDIIQRLREQLPPGATIVEEEDYIIFRALGQKPIIYNALKVSLAELEETAQQIIETAKAVSFVKEV